MCCCWFEVFRYFVECFEKANLFTKIISGNGTEAQNNVVYANAGLAIATAKNISHKEGFKLAKASLISGKAKESLDKLIELSKK